MSGGHEMKHRENRGVPASERRVKHQGPDTDWANFAHPGVTHLGKHARTWEESYLTMSGFSLRPTSPFL